VTSLREYGILPSAPPIIDDYYASARPT